MIYPEEKDTIIDRLRTIARERDTFTVADCIGRFGLAQHNSNDWAECSDELIAKGELLKTGDYHEYKVVKKEETMENKVYKALMEVDGRLESVIAGLGQFTGFKQLTYKEGEITYAPEGSLGLFVYTEIDRAKHLLLDNLGYTTRGRRVICEATPLGNRIKKNSGDCFECSTRYPAILLGKEVWRDKPKEPTEVERLCEARALLGGDIRTCTQTGLHFCREDRKYALYRKQGVWALYEGNRHLVATKDTLQEVVTFVEQDKPRPEPKFKVGDRVRATDGCYKGQTFTVVELKRGDMRHKHWHCYTESGCPIDEDYLELAPEPKEEWVNITKECNIHFGNYGQEAFINIQHNGRNLYTFGGRNYDWETPDYKVEFMPSETCGYFKILKKVV